MRYATSTCIFCGKTAIGWHGHVLAKEKMALGNYIDKKIGAGWCEEHHEDFGESDDGGCYGLFNNDTMKIMPEAWIFKTQEERERLLNE